MTYTVKRWGQTQENTMPIDTNGATTFPHVEWHKAVLFAALKAAKVERIVCGWALPHELDVPRADGRHHWRQQDVVGKWCYERVLFVARFEAEGEEYRTATVTLLTTDETYPGAPVHFLPTEDTNFLPCMSQTMELPKAVMAFAMTIDEEMISSIFDVSQGIYMFWLDGDAFRECADPDAFV